MAYRYNHLCCSLLLQSSKNMGNQNRIICVEREHLHFTDGTSRAALTVGPHSFLYQNFSSSFHPFPSFPAPYLGWKEGVSMEGGKCGNKRSEN